MWGLPRVCVVDTRVEGVGSSRTRCKSRHSLSIASVWGTFLVTLVFLPTRPPKPLSES